jgi:hypothetical protein
MHPLTPFSRYAARPLFSDVYIITFEDLDRTSLTLPRNAFLTGATSPPKAALFPHPRGAKAFTFGDRLDTIAKTRKGYDPGNRLLNDYFKELLGAW